MAKKKNDILIIKEEEEFQNLILQFARSSWEEPENHLMLLPNNQDSRKRIGYKN